MIRMLEKFQIRVPENNVMHLKITYLNNIHQNSSKTNKNLIKTPKMCRTFFKNHKKVIKK